MKFRFSLLLALIVGLSISMETRSQLPVGVTSVTVTPTVITACDSVTYNIGGAMAYINSTLDSVKHSVFSDTININVHTTNPLIGLGLPVPFSRVVTVAPYPAGTYKLLVNYRASNPIFTPINHSDSLVVDSVQNVVAGRDTTFCDTNAALLVGSTPGAGSTGSWTVISGGSTLNNPSSPTTTVSNLGHGTHEFEYTVTNGTCALGASDRVVIKNDEMPSKAVIPGGHFNVCEGDSAELVAIPPTVGSGLWTVKSGGSTLSLPNSSTTKAYGLSENANWFQWTVTNGAVCPFSAQTVRVNRFRNEPSTISRTDTFLTATTNDNYQWYKDGNMIAGAMTDSLIVYANGVYKVATHHDSCAAFPMFSNEITITDLEDSVGTGITGPGQLSQIQLYPNPTDGVTTVDFGSNQSQVDLLLTNMQGQVVGTWSYKAVDAAQLDIQAPSGMYFLQVTTSEGSTVMRLVRD